MLGGAVVLHNLESLIRDHIMSYLLENDLLSTTKQYGLLKGNQQCCNCYRWLINGRSI